MKSERIAAAVNGLKQGTDVGALVWDGARGHREPAGGDGWTANGGAACVQS